jgi:hypothetical protein
MRFISKVQWTLLIYFLLFFTSAPLFAQQQEAGQDRSNFNADTNYDVYYEVSNFEVDTVENVKIIGVEPIHDRSFLVIKGSDFLGKEKVSYILFDSVKAILTNGYIKVKRIFDQKYSSKSNQ